MGWYPDMGCYGGYWSYNPYYPGSVFFASFGLWFDIGGHHYDGWGSYHHYYDGHSAPYHITVFNRNIYASTAELPAERSIPWNGPSV